MQIQQDKVKRKKFKIYLYKRNVRIHQKNKLLWNWEAFRFHFKRTIFFVLSGPIKQGKKLFLKMK